MDTHTRDRTNRVPATNNNRPTCSARLEFIVHSEWGKNDMALQFIAMNVHRLAFLRFEYDDLTCEISVHRPYG